MYSVMAPDSAMVLPASVTTGDFPSGWIARSSAGASCQAVADNGRFRRERRAPPTAKAPAASGNYLDDARSAWRCPKNCALRRLALCGASRRLESRDAQLSGNITRVLLTSDVS